MKIFNHLQSRLNIIFILLGIIPILVVSGIISQHSQNLLQQDAQFFLLERADHLAAKITAFIEGRTNTLEYIAKVNGLSDDEQTALINGMLAFDTAFQEISILDETGMELARVSRNEVILRDNLRDRSNSTEYIAIMQDKEPLYYSEVRFDESLREPLMTIAVPVTNQRTGETDKVLVADFRFRSIWQLLGAQNYRDGETAYVLNTSHHIVAHPNPSLVLQNTTFEITNIRAGQTQDNQGEDILFASKNITFGQVEFVIVAVQTKSNALALSRYVWLIAAIVSLVSLTVASILTILFVRGIVRPITHLSDVSQAIANGDRSIRADVYGKDELSVLAITFNRMTEQLESSITELEMSLDELKLAEDALRDKHGELERFFSLTPDLLCIIDTKGYFVKVNQAWESVLGYSTEMFEGKLFTDFLHPDDVEISQNAMVQFNEGMHPTNFINRYRTKDGEYRSLEWMAKAHNDFFYAAAKDITESKRLEQFTLENERLKVRFQKEQEQNTFTQRIISMLSHDLRTPLSVIVSSRDILERYFNQLTEERRQEKLEVIGRQVKFALKLLDDTVNLARGNLLEREFRPVMINLDALCRVSIDEVRVASKSNHQLIFNNLGGVASYPIDEVLVSRILMNLLSNAIKYSPNGSDIVLELDQNKEWIILRVCDKGIGISEKDISQIFEPFYRSEEVQDIKGTGLGLNIVRDCVIRHQGQISIESNLGEGTTFIIELPLQPKIDNISE